MEKTSGPSGVGGLTAGPAKLAGLVDYQAGAVVSREILRKAGGTVTLFAFDQGQGLGEHTAPYDALVHVLAGEAEVSISSGRALRLNEGEIVIMLADEPHSVAAPEKCRMLLVMIRS